MHAAIDAAAIESIDVGVEFVVRAQYDRVLVFLGACVLDDPEPAPRSRASGKTWARLLLSRWMCRSRMGKSSSSAREAAPSPAGAG
jgi:hypothetical protein